MQVSDLDLSALNIEPGTCAVVATIQPTLSAVAAARLRAELEACFKGTPADGLPVLIVGEGMTINVLNVPEDPFPGVVP